MALEQEVRMKDLVGSVIGAFKANVPLEYTKHDYECAAWWEQHRSKTGVFPVRLKLSYDGRRYFAHTEIPAVVTDDFFPALYCGVSVSKTPYKSQHVGEERIITKTISLYEGIDQSGHSVGDNEDYLWCIFPDFWPTYIEYCERQLDQDYAVLPKWWADYKAGENEFFSKVSMVGHFAERMSEWVKAVHDIKTDLARIKSGASWIKMFRDNTSWTEPVRQSLPEEWLAEEGKK